MWFARLLGLLTVLYSVVAMIRPRILVTPAGLVARPDPVPGPLRVLTRAVGARDTAIGLAVMLAPMTAPLAVALLLRIAADLSDAAVFGLSVPEPAARRRTLAVTLGWAALNLVALWAVLT
jgi:hypothetical protein